MFRIHILIQIHSEGISLKRPLSFKQWAAALILFTGFCTATLFGYMHRHADTEFEAFAEEFFLQEMQANPIHFHYSVDDPSIYNIDESSLTMPIYHEGEAANDTYAISMIADKLDKFDQMKLSDSNSYLCGLMRSYIDTVSRTASYPYFSEPLSPSSGAPSELPILLAEYRFDTVEDVDLYLSILTQIPDYFNGLIVYEREKAAAGLFMSDSTAAKVIRQCTTLMDSAQLEDNSHFLETTFADRLQPLVEKGLLTEDEALYYQYLNNRLLTTVVAPAYDRLADDITLLMGSGKDTCGLACREGGRDYYEALLRLQTGSYREIDEIKQLLYRDLTSNYEALRQLFENNVSLRDQLNTERSLLPEMSPEETLSYLKASIQQDYPAVPASDNTSPIRCTVKYVDDSLEPYTAPAFYMTPPIDNVLNNTIYINALDTSDDLSLFTTLAHEGYPGHLYQTVYCQRFRDVSGISPLCSVLYYGGYIEGWAMYAELSSYDYAIKLAVDTNPDAAQYYLACRLDRQIQLCLYSLLDITIHYDGASLEDVQEIFHSLGSASNETITAVYEYIAEEPCNYPKYYLGYLEIMELKKQALEIWYDDQTSDACIPSDFLYQFHRFVLENGPADFRTLSARLYDIS